MMKRVAAIALSLAIGTACAGDLIFRSVYVTVRLTSAPCKESALRAALLQASGDEHALVAKVASPDGKQLLACWVQDQDGDALIADETGMLGYILADEFEEVNDL